MKVGSAGFLLLVHVVASATANRVPVAYDMVKSTSLNLLSYSNIWTNAFLSSDDGFRKYSRASSSTTIPPVMLDETNNPAATVPDTHGIVAYGDNDEFFGVADTINPQNLVNAVQAVWQFSIAGATDLAFSVDVAAMGNFETAVVGADYFRWTVKIDGNVVQEVLNSTVDESTSQSYTLADEITKTILDDPLKVNGIKLSNEFKRFIVPIGGIGSVATVTLEAVANENFEAIAFRNLKILAQGPNASCPESQCTTGSVTVAQPVAAGCTLTAVSLQKHLHTNGDVLVELFGPANPADAIDLVVSVPHGGTFKPSYIPDRSTNHTTYCPSSGCTLGADSYTKEIGLLIQEKFIDNYCKVPYVAVIHLHRIKLDGNRAVGEAAQGDVTAIGAWQAFHDLIAAAQILVKNNFGTVTGSTGLVGVKGLLLDLHGYAGTDFQAQYGSPLIQWGFRLGMEDSLNPVIYCPVDEQSSGSIGSMTHARWMPGQSLECLVRGPGAIASRLAAVGPDLCGASTPSFNFPSPLTIATSTDSCAQMVINSTPCFYYNGGYDIKVHERIGWENATGEYFNAVQAELPRCIRFGGTTAHEAIANNLSIAIMSFLRDVFGP